MNEHRCTGARSSDVLFAVLVIIAILVYIVCSEHKDTQAHVTTQVAELKSQITALTEALEKHDEVLKELSERKEWWQKRNNTRRGYGSA